MKVVLTVHQFLPDFFARTEIIALGIARELVQRGHEVTVVTGFPSRTALTGAKRFDSYVYENIRVERFWHSPAGAGAGENVVESDYDNPVFGRFLANCGPMSCISCIWRICRLRPSGRARGKRCR